MRPIVLVVVLVFGGCATEHRTLNTEYSPSVPFIPQKPGHCGPAALAMLANHYGHTVTQDDIANAIYLPDIHGTLTAELADYARRFRLFVRQYRGSEADLHQKLAAGIPLIVLGKLGANWHYFVVLAADRDTVTVHSGTEPLKHLSTETFLRWWNRAGRWTLLICPSEKATWPLTAAEHNDLGVFYEKTNGDLCAAEMHYRQAATLQPDNPYHHLNLGNSLRKQHRLPEAAAAFARAPENADALNNRADVLRELGEHLDEAAALCHRAIELMPSHRTWYLDTLGSIRLKQGMRSEAIAAYEAALAATTDRQASLRAGINQRLAAARALAEK